MRAISHIVIHCTATRQDVTIANIKKYWQDVRGWKAPGYHYIIEASGNFSQLAQLSEITNGVAGWNKSLINIAYIGGVDAAGKAVDNRTAAQKQSLLYLVRELKKQFPAAIVQGHRDFAGVAKDCPSFDAKKEYAKL